MRFPLRPEVAARLLLKIGTAGRDDTRIREAHALLTELEPDLAPKLAAVRVMPRMVKYEAIALLRHLIFVNASGSYYRSGDPLVLTALLVHEQTHVLGGDEPAARAAEDRFIATHRPAAGDIQESLNSAEAPEVLEEHQVAAPDRFVHNGLTFQRIDPPTIPPEAMKTLAALDAEARRMLEHHK